MLSAHVSLDAWLFPRFGHRPAPLHPTAFGVVTDGGTEMGSSTPYVKRDQYSMKSRPRVFLAAQTACDSSGGIMLDDKRMIAREGKFCDSGDFPLNTICVKSLPMDWCPSTRPHTTFLPPKWRPVFVREKPINPVAGIDSVSPEYYANVVAVDPITGNERYVLADQGDACCPTRRKQVKIPTIPMDKATTDVEGAEGLPVRNCEDHWGQPWCVTPAALYRYMINHPNWSVDIDCAATSQPRVGVLGAICDMQDRKRWTAAAYNERTGDAAWERQYEQLMTRKEDMKDNSKGKDTNEDTNATDPAAYNTNNAIPEKAPGGSQMGSWTGLHDPRKTSGGLAEGYITNAVPSPLIRPGADFGIFGGETVQTKQVVRPYMMPKEEEPHAEETDSGGEKEPAGLSEEAPVGSDGVKEEDNEVGEAPEQPSPNPESANGLTPEHGSENEPPQEQEQTGSAHGREEGEIIEI